MKSFQDPDRTFAGMPPHLGVLLKRVDRSSGRQQLYEDQVPELLRRLAQQTKVESITASNAIEGVEVDPDRAAALAGPDRPGFRNRSEKEFAGISASSSGSTSQSTPITRRSNSRSAAGTRESIRSGPGSNT